MTNKERNKLILFKNGFFAGIPICLGYFAVSFTFGIQAGKVGLNWFEAILMSITNLTSAGQFGGLDLIASNAFYGEMAITQLILNLRYLLMSCSLSQKLESKTSLKQKLLVAYGVTDEIFGVSMCTNGKLSPYFSYGAICCAVPGWTLGTLLGITLGNVLPNNVLSALGIAIYGMFLAVIIPPAKKKRPILIVVLSSMLLSGLFFVIPFIKNISSGFRIIIITILISCFAAWKFPIKEDIDNAE